jgi:hypothetical protein
VHPCFNSLFEQNNGGQFEVANVEQNWDLELQIKNEFWDYKILICLGGARFREGGKVIKIFI